jgi:hypothetical protein
MVDNGRAGGARLGRGGYSRAPGGALGRLSWRSVALALPVALLLLGSLTTSVQARPARDGTRVEEAHARRTAAREQRAAAREQRAAAREERAAARKTRHKRRERPPESERENAIVTSTCSIINWTFRKFPDLPHNSLFRRITVGRFAHVYQRLEFDGPGVSVTTPVNAPPGQARIDTLAKWRTNGAKGGFDILSMKKCPPAPALTIEKLQQIAGSGSGFTTSPLTGKVNQTVEYEIIVRNTGNVPLVLSNFSDPRCDGGTIAGGQGETPLAPGAMPSLGASTTYTCSHVLTSADQTAGSYSNTATDTGAPPGGGPITHTSNTVVVNLPPPPSPRVYVGYADGAENDHGSPSGFPTPWKGSAGVTFIGCGFGGTDSCPTSKGLDVYDAGAIRIDASSGTGAVSVTGAKVVIGPCTYEPWPGLNVTIQPEQSLILTQTGKHKCAATAAAEQDNFDTSESFLKSPQYQEFQKTGTCSNDGYVPAITLTINGHATTLSDTSQTLNDRGIDSDICNHTSEAANWTQLQFAASRHFSALSCRTTTAHRRRKHATAHRASSLAGGGSRCPAKAHADQTVPVTFL